MIKKKESISYEEFIKTIYYTQLYIKIPLLDIKLEKVNYFTKGKYDIKKINSKLYEIYEENKFRLLG